jgi:hypothetical protein
MGGLTTPAIEDAWRFQRPAPGQLVIDHLGHYVPDPEAGAIALARLGFSIPPFSAHLHRTDPAGPLVPAGTGNRCVMLERGYLEFLSPIADIPNAREVLAALKHYIGVHLIAFGTADAGADHARLAAQGFSPMPVVDLQRAVETADGKESVRFGVIRLPVGAMEEGRIQFCEQRAPQVIWQPRWMEHPNRAVALQSVFICNRDPAGAAQRFARFTGLAAEKFATGFRMATARGDLYFLDAGLIESWLGVRAPQLPWIAAYALGVDDLDASRRHFAASGLPVRELGAQGFAVSAPPAVGGTILFRAGDAPVFP